ncbi:AsmA family protein [Hyphomicrobium sp. CS1GBMeth3]|uniref:AsmA family protein n=1 Tax=Hyphomicrobium sp. CS1GBMeth3 TaxID=1892845 RepID=UPI0009FAB130|nr:AsmA family protein [Hyphomicrobium sp. CS1GBMeth3]
MTGKADRRRPLLVAIGLIAAIGAALVAPVMVGARKGEPIPGTTVRADSRERLAITAPIALFQTPSVVLEKGTVALVGPAAGENRIGARLYALMTGGTADLVLDGARLIVDRRGQSAASETSASPAASTTHADAPALSEDLRPVAASLSAFKFRSLTILDSTLVFETASGGQETVSLVNVEVAPARGGLLNMKGQIEFRGEPLTVDLTVPDPQTVAPGTPAQIRAAVKGEHVALAFNGRLTSGDVAQLTADGAELSITDLRSVADWVGLSWPSGPGLGAFSARGRLTLDERSASFEHAEFTLDGNAATGALMMKLGAERPSVEGTLAFSAFDVAPYATPSRPYALALASDWVSSLRVPGLVSPSFLRDLDADIRLSAASVTSGSDRLGRGAASISVRNGKLYGEIVELELEQGGRGEGQFTIDSTGAEPLYTLRTELNDIDLATVAAPRLGPAALDGLGDIRLDVRASGSSEADIAKSLAGTIALDMSEGGRVGLNLEALPAAAAAAPAPPTDGWRAVGAATTTVSTLTARFTAANGALTTDKVEATVDERVVTATGSVDIDKGAVDLVLSITPAPAAAGASNKALGAFKIEGPWSAPTISPAVPGKAADATPTSKDPG